MVFSSNIFLFLYLPIVLTSYLLLPGLKLKNGFLLAASLVFYAWGEVLFVWVMVASIAMNYLFGLYVDRYRGTPFAGRTLFVACVVNLGLLAVFKYWDFAVQNIDAGLRLLGLPEIQAPHLHLPIGISFFTFHALSYVIDVHRNDAPVQKSPFRIALYIALFSQLVAGPILRYADIAPQLAERRLQLAEMSYGVQRFIIGLGKKVLIANTVAAAADPIFSMPSDQLTASIAWLGIVCYTLQIYFDFSGYSDMAIGLGHIFGFTFRENFQWPYASASVKEFWRRWHISLSTWFRDYLYVPLGGNKRGAFRTHVNLIVVFFLCGLWHGASWTFVVWGLYHGMFLVLERTRFGTIVERLPRFLRHLYVLLVVMIGWVFFRSETFSQALAYLAAMTGLGEGDGVRYYLGMFWSNRLAVAIVAGTIGSAPVFRWLSENAERWSSRPVRPGLRACAMTAKMVTPIALALVFLLSAMSLASGTHNPFIYFRF